MASIRGDVCPVWVTPVGRTRDLWQSKHMWTLPTPASRPQGILTARLAPTPAAEGSRWGETSVSPAPPLCLSSHLGSELTGP